SRQGDGRRSRSQEDDMWRMSVLGWGLVGCHHVNPRAEQVALLEGDEGAGEAVYVADCVECHGEDGVGTEALHNGVPVNLTTTTGSWCSSR
ncbi:MAG: hypothetical protein ABMA64_42550, partial [Myxococcota bacterium]